MVPGFVNEMDAPDKSSTVSLLFLAFVINPSYSAQKSVNVICCAFLMLGTTNMRMPSLRVTSTASPMFMDALLIL